MKWDKIVKNEYQTSLRTKVDILIFFYFFFFLAKPKDNQLNIMYD